eukprot:scaffold20873_cov48-Phaeocystis_antarctica.AAC.2
MARIVVFGGARLPRMEEQSSIGPLARGRSRCRGGTAPDAANRRNLRCWISSRPGIKEGHRGAFSVSPVSHSGPPPRPHRQGDPPARTVLSGRSRLCAGRAVPWVSSWERPPLCPPPRHLPPQRPPLAAARRSCRRRRGCRNPPAAGMPRTVAATLTGRCRSPAPAGLAGSTAAPAAPVAAAAAAAASAVRTAGTAAAVQSTGPPPRPHHRAAHRAAHQRRPSAAAAACLGLGAGLGLGLGLG